jgi:tetratricopeptide (TPR) repeat protein
MASAARAFVCAKDYFRAARCYETAQKPLDAARLYLQIRHWEKAAELYAQAGDSLRAELALEQIKRSKEPQPTGAAAMPSVSVAVPAGSAPNATAPPVSPAPPNPRSTSWPEGPIWEAIKAGDVNAATTLYLKSKDRSGWQLMAEAVLPEAMKGLAEMLFQARDHAVAAEAFRKAGETMRAAQCLSLAGLNEEAADLFVRCNMMAAAAQHLEKAHHWEQAAVLYGGECKFLDAARCHEKADDPVKAAALYLKAKEPDLALPLLQSVPPSHKGFAQCRLLAAKILFQKGQGELAMAVLSPLLQAAPKSEEEFEAYYQAAVMMEQGGAVERAGEAYRRMQQLRFGFRDVGARLKALSEAEQVPAKLMPSEAQAQSGAAEMDLSPLRECSLFGRLGLEDLRRLWVAGRAMPLKIGEVLVNVGEMPKGLAIVLSGGLTITPDPNNPNVAAGFLGTGDYVGLGCILNGPPQQNALVAQAGTRVLLVSRESLENLLAADPEMGMRFYQSVAEHLVQALKAGRAVQGERPDDRR